MAYRNAQEVRKELQRVVGTISDKDWNDLVKFRAVEIVQSDGRLDFLKDRYYDLRERSGDYRKNINPSVKLPSGSLIKTRAEVLGRIVVRLTQRDPEVIEFRRKVLRGKLLPESKVVQWI